MKYLTDTEYQRLVDALFTEVDMITVYKDQSHYYSDTIYCHQKDTEVIITRLSKQLPHSRIQSWQLHNTD